MALLEILKDQAAFGFTGKINVLLKDSGQFVGVIYQKEGSIVDASTAKLKGRKALFRLIFQDVENDNLLKYVVEPELIKEENNLISLNFDDLKNQAEKYFQVYINSKKLKPPTNLKLLVDPEVILSDEIITSEEFDVLSLIVDWCSVSDIYTNSTLLDFELTNCLISLRKKKAIKVFQS